MESGSPLEPMPEGAERSTEAKPEQKKAVPNRPTKKQLYGMLAATVLVGIIGFLWYIGVLGGNVHAVKQGRVYRSAQLTGKAIGPLTACWTGNSLAQVIEANGIKTVLNLRGGSMKNDWYREEVETCARLGVKHVDVSMSAIRAPNPIQLKRVLETFDTARYPILFHCQGGADRSGLVGTLYLHLYQGVPLDEAQVEQMTFRYGHISASRAGVLDRFLNLYRRGSRGMGLRQWISEVYPAMYAEMPPNLQSDPPKQQEIRGEPIP